MKSEKTHFNNLLGIKGWFYAGNYFIERYAYILHRITGLALIFYLCLHVLVNFTKINKDWWNWLMANLLNNSNPAIKIFEFLLMVAFLYHALNGLRLIFTELGIFLGKPKQPKYPYITSVQKQRVFLFIMMILAGIFVVFSGHQFFFK